MHLLLLLLLALSPASWGQEPPDLAEAQRLQAEVSSLAQRQAWSGADRAYRAAEKTGAPLAPDIHRIGVSAALEIGDLSAARSRLETLIALAPADDLFEWKWSIDLVYARVALVALPGAKLVAEERPFDPQKARAIDHAAKLIAESGHFDGLLPAGQYIIANRRFSVVGGDDTVKVDATPEPAGRKRGKKR